jgi:hypothetical protein
MFHQAHPVILPINSTNTNLDQSSGGENFAFVSSCVDHVPQRFISRAQVIVQLFKIFGGLRVISNLEELDSNL